MPSRNSSEHSTQRPLPAHQETPALVQDVDRQVPAASWPAARVLTQAKVGDCAGVSDHFGVNSQRPREPQGCVETAAEAEQRYRSLPHRGEMPKCWGRPSEIAEDTALSSWSDHFGVKGCVETAAEAEQRCRSLPHRGEMPQCWGRGTMAWLWTTRRFIGERVSFVDSTREETKRAQWLRSTLNRGWYQHQAYTLLIPLRRKSKTE